MSGRSSCQRQGAGEGETHRPGGGRDNGAVSIGNAQAQTIFSKLI